MQAITAPKPVQTVEPASQAPYRALFECAPVGILIGTAEGACIDANHSLCEMLGFTHEELVGLRRSDYVADTEIPTGTPSLDVIRTHSALGHTDAFTGRVRQFRPKDGSTFEAEVLTTVMPDGTRLEFIKIPPSANGKMRALAA
jgi:PAS domain S-box-containing protein